MYFSIRSPFSHSMVKVRAPEVLLLPILVLSTLFNRTKLQFKPLKLASTHLLELTAVHEQQKHFREGRTNIGDDLENECSCISIADENVDRVREFVRSDR
ncbi:hypothetical protein J6590_087612 [Homalodisca vitripennis]|nr:hypothetical protein J6590_087612 [Homalodisca vitripennis]